jgi:cyclopropane-fatty-acyl-phospholipid synthase
MAYKPGKFTGIFLRIVKQYVRFYREYSFKFSFDGNAYPVQGDSDKIVEVRIKHTERVFYRIFNEGSLGLGESYCEGLIDVDDRDYKYFLFIFIRTIFNKHLLFRLSPVDLITIAKANIFQLSFTRGDCDEDINCHYSLSDWFDNEWDSNRFYLYFLDAQYIHYSCGLWYPDTRTCEEAQDNKCRFYAERLGIDQNSNGKSLLDLGCGWGGFIFWVAEKFGIRCKGVTLSRAQAKYVEEEIERRNLSHLVSVEINNIHNISGKYNYIVSIGVLEHISDYDDLYKKTARCLAEGGSALFHSMFHRSWFYRGDPFMLKYIFIRGGTPHIKRNLRIFSKYFEYVDRNELPGLSYPKTVQCWYDRFCANEGEIRRLLEEKGKCRDIDFSIRTFKHYLMLGYCAQAERGLVCNILLRESRARLPNLHDPTGHNEA